MPDDEMELMTPASECRFPACRLPCNCIHYKAAEVITTSSGKGWLDWFRSRGRTPQFTPLDPLAVPPHAVADRLHLVASSMPPDAPLDTYSTRCFCCRRTGVKSHRVSARMPDYSESPVFLCPDCWRILGSRGLVH